MFTQVTNALCVCCFDNKQTTTTTTLRAFLDDTLSSIGQYHLTTSQWYIHHGHAPSVAFLPSPNCSTPAAPAVAGWPTESLPWLDIFTTRPHGCSVTVEEPWGTERPSPPFNKINFSTEFLKLQFTVVRKFGFNVPSGWTATEFPTVMANVSVGVPQRSGHLNLCARSHVAYRSCFVASLRPAWPGLARPARKHNHVTDYNQRIAPFELRRRSAAAHAPLPTRTNGCVLKI